MNHSGAECERARDLLPLYVDADLPEEVSRWVARHLEECGACQAEAVRFREMDREVIAWGERMDTVRPRRRMRLHWAIPAAAAIAAALTLVIVTPQRTAPSAVRAPDQFVPIPYLPPTDPRENIAVIRVNVRVAALAALGYKVAADPAAMVLADVLVGEDGRARAVRLLSQSNDRKGE